MGGIGWQELVILLTILAIGAVAYVPIYLVIQARKPLSRPSGETDSAGFWLRAGGEIVDLLLIGVLSSLAAWLVGLVTRTDEATAPQNLTAWAVAVAYVVVGNGRGATPGKRWARLRVIDANGGAPGVQRAAVRAVLPYGLRVLLLLVTIWASTAQESQDGGAGLPMVLFAVIVLVIAAVYLWMIRDPRKQTLHDKLASTFVVLSA